MSDLSHVDESSGAVHMVDVGGKPVSRIMAEFGAGALVTTPRHQVDVVVTEYGSAELAGLTVGQRAVALAEIAHPDFREALRERARTR